MIGRTVSHYKFIDKIASGGMSVVYKVRDIKLKQPVALRFLPALATDNKDRCQRFANDAKSASLLDHPNIWTIFKISTDDEEIFIAKFYSSGKTIIVIWQLSLHIILILYFCNLFFWGDLSYTDQR